MVGKLKYDEKPNYNKLRDIFVKGLSSHGQKDTWKLSLPVGGAAKMSSPKVSTCVKVFDFVSMISLTQ